MFDAFPKELSHDVEIVQSLISKKTFNIVCLKKHTYTLLNEQIISFPDRIYYEDEFEIIESKLTFEQKMIYHCIFSRSNNGYIREKHIKYILKENYPDWTIPYIVKISDEYVLEILEDIYFELTSYNNDKMKTFCKMNIQLFLKSYDRMISYWNEYYRDNCPHYKDYIGTKLFLECFGYKKSMEKEQNLNKNSL